MKPLTIQILANCPVSAKSMGGGDRIMIENARRWQKWGAKINLWGSPESIGMAQNNNLHLPYKVIVATLAQKWGIYIAYLARMVKMLFVKLPIKKSSVVYSASEFLPDVVGPYLAKRKTNFIWIVGFYLVYKNPFGKEEKLNFRNAVTFITQRLSLNLIKKRADQVWVLCQEDKKTLSNLGIKSEKIRVVSAGVDQKLIAQVPEMKKIYDGCFVGRFHPQKGLPDLLLAWQKTVARRPQAKLAIIGWGEKYWVDFLKREIRRLKLTNNIKLLGFLDGRAKYKEMKSAKVLIFPSHHESWGIVAIEAMAAGLPVVAYNLPIFEETYGQALVQAPLGDVRGLSENILHLLENEQYYEMMETTSLRMAHHFSWDKIAKDNLNNLYNLN